MIQDVHLLIEPAQRASERLAAAIVLARHTDTAPPDEETLGRLRELLLEAVGAARSAEATVAPHGIGQLSVTHLCRRSIRERALCGATMGMSRGTDAFAVGEPLEYLRWHSPATRCAACSAAASTRIEGQLRQGERAMDACVSLYSHAEGDDAAGPLGDAARLGRAILDQRVVEMRVAEIRDGEVLRD